MKKLFITLIAIISGIGVSVASNIQKATYIYSAPSAGDTLRFDLYTDADVEAPESGRPAVIFAFGGSFKTGSRDAAEYIPYFNFLAEHGYAVASIDYRTGMKNFNPATGATGFVSSLENAVTMAVTDLLNATGYIVSNASTLQINPQQIVASGSSAGAITVLQAEYLLGSGSPMIEMIFPNGFNYAGVVSFAGAIMSTDGKPEFKSAPCPILMFHGDADTVVPYDHISVGQAGLYGSKWIATELAEKGYSREFYTICASSHEVAVTPMTQNQYDVLAFLKEMVADGSKRITDVKQTAPDAPKEYKTDFTLMDYLRSNM